MSNRNRMDAITDVTAIKARSPLTIEEEDRRKFVRLQINSPMTLNRIKDIFGTFKADGGSRIEAEILNLSACGVLVEVGQPLNQGDVVGMHFSVEGIERMAGVLGLVKRTEVGEDFHLAGIQFVTRRQLEDSLSKAELELMSDNFTDFDHSVREVLGRHLYHEAN